MGRAARWFRNLLGLKKPFDSSSSPFQRSDPVKEKRRWSFVRSHNERPIVNVDRAADRLSEKDRDDTVEISASDRVTVGGGHGREVMSAVEVGFQRKRGLDRLASAAVVIQSAFRGYLARRALRALKGLVKIQALVRGYIVRKKRTAEWLSQMQALLRAQARARKDRAQNAVSSQSSSKCYLFAKENPVPVTPDKLEPMYQVKSNFRDRSPALRKSGSCSKWSQSLGSGEGDRFLEADGRKTRSGGNNVPTSGHLHRTSRSFTTSKDSSFSEVQSAAYPVGCLHDDFEEDSEFLTADNSPQFYSASSMNRNSRRSPFTPSRSEDSRSYYDSHSYYPNYMSFTESSRAKVRSTSAPKQRMRPHLEKAGSVKRNSMHGFGEKRSASQKSPTVFTGFAKKGYPGSGRLDQYGIPVRGSAFDDYCVVD